MAYTGRLLSGNLQYCANNVTVSAKCAIHVTLPLILLDFVLHYK